MSVTDQLNEARLDGSNNEPRLVLDLDLIEAQALRAWLLETELNGLSAQDTPVVSTALAKLGRRSTPRRPRSTSDASSSRRASPWLTGPTSRYSSSAVASRRRLAPSWAASRTGCGTDPGSQAAGERHVKSGRRAPSDAIEALRLVRSRQDVAALATAIARRLDVPEAEITEIENAMHLCDVGNVAVPRAVLSYPGKITGPEWEFILLHTVVGARLIAGPLGLEPVAPLVRYRHERSDGAGYPDGLAGEAIPIGSRIVFVCSAFHDMTSDRPHHEALEPADALAQLERGAGSQFDPEVVAAFRAEFVGESDESALEDEAAVGA
jgi:hypothetical protein